MHVITAIYVKDIGQHRDIEGLRFSIYFLYVPVLCYCAWVVLFPSEKEMIDEGLWCWRGVRNSWMPNGDW
jgi:hypothetical protein